MMTNIQLSNKSSINFGQRIRIAKDEDSKQKIKQTAISASGTASMASAAISGADALASSFGALSNLTCIPPGLFTSLIISPDLTSDILSNVKPIIILSADTASAIGLGAAGAKLLDKYLPSDEEQAINSDEEQTIPPDKEDTDI